METQHGDMVHDAQLDYYGKKLATCSSDRTIKVCPSLPPSLRPSLFSLPSVL